MLGLRQVQLRFSLGLAQLFVTYDENRAHFRMTQDHLYFRMETLKWHLIYTKNKLHLYIASKIKRRPQDIQNRQASSVQYTETVDTVMYKLGYQEYALLQRSLESRCDSNTEVTHVRFMLGLCSVYVRFSLGLGQVQVRFSLGLGNIMYRRQSNG